MGCHSACSHLGRSIAARVEKWPTAARLAPYKARGRRTPPLKLRPPMATVSWLPSSFRPSLSSPSLIPPFGGRMRVSRRPTRRSLPPGTLARVVGDLASSACSRRAMRTAGEQHFKKIGVPHVFRAPRKCVRRITASSRPFSSRPWQPSSPLFSPQVVVTQPPTVRMAVTTGGLSHPPSYQM